jgi:hypothetical protein
MAVKVARSTDKAALKKRMRMTLCDMNPESWTKNFRGFYYAKKTQL